MNEDDVVPVLVVGLAMRWPEILFLGGEVLGVVQPLLTGGALAVVVLVVGRCVVELAGGADEIRDRALECPQRQVASGGGQLAPGALLELDELAKLASWDLRAFVVAVPFRHRHIVAVGVRAVALAPVPLGSSQTVQVRLQRGGVPADEVAEGAPGWMLVAEIGVAVEHQPEHRPVLEVVDPACLASHEPCRPHQVLGREAVGEVASGPWCKRATGVGSLEPPSTREDLHPWHDEYRLSSASAPRSTSCSDRGMTSP